MAAKKTNLEKMMNEFGKKRDEESGAQDSSQPAPTPTGTKEGAKEKKEKLKNLPVMIQESLWKRLKFYSIDRGTSLSAIMRELIEKKLEEEGR